MISFYFYINRSKTTTTNDNTSNYQPFLGGDTTKQNQSDNPNSTNGDQNQNTNNPSTTQTSGQQLSKFHKITDFAVAGATFFEDTRPIPTPDEVTLTGGEQPNPVTPPIKIATPIKTKNNKIIPPKIVTPKFEIVPSIRYVERATGHISQMYLDTKTVGQISNSTIPNIYEAIFDDKASSVIYRYLEINGKIITSFLATLGSDKGEFLPSNIIDVSLSPDRTKFFYITKIFSGVIGTTRSFKDNKKIQVFSSSITEWLSQWVTDQKIYLTTKASSSTEGNLFSLNTTNGVLTKVFGGVLGLTTLTNNDGSLVLYSSSTSGGPKLGIFDIKNHTTKDLNLYGLPEKCLWLNINIYCAIPNNASGNGYPDIWYQGLASFNDRFVKINSNTNEVTNIADSESETPIDGTHLFLTNKEDQLFFINKKDSTLWSLDLN